MTDWAAKVLEGVERYTPPYTKGNWIKEADALAAIARMGAWSGAGRVGGMYEHPGYRKPYPIQTVLRDLASQEGCDGEPYDAMVFAASYIDCIIAHIAALTAQNREMALDVLASSGQAADAYAAQLAAEAERDALRAQMAENRISEPHDPGDFVGDIFYGHPIKTTMGTHRWTGTEWVALPSEAEALAGLLAGARKEAAALRERVARLEGAMRWIIENNDEGNGLYSRDGLYAKRARAALNDGGKDG